MNEVGAWETENQDWLKCHTQQTQAACYVLYGTDQPHGNKELIHTCMMHTRSDQPFPGHGLHSSRTNLCGQSSDQCFRDIFQTGNSTSGWQVRGGLRLDEEGKVWLMGLRFLIPAAHLVIQPSGTIHRWPEQYRNSIIAATAWACSVAWKWAFKGRCLIHPAHLTQYDPSSCLKVLHMLCTTFAPAHHRV